MRKFFKFCSHADVLSSHKSFEWDAVVDPNSEKLDLAKNKWDIPIVVKDIKDLPENYKVMCCYFNACRYKDADNSIS